MQPLHKQIVMYPATLATASSSLTSDELSILMSLLGGTIQGKSCSKFSLNIKDYAEVKGISIRNAKRVLKKGVEDLWEGKFTYIDELDRVTDYRWIITVAYGVEEYEITLHPDLVALITEIKKYIPVKLLSIGGLKNKASYFLFFYILGTRANHRESYGRTVFDILEFREKLKVENTYKGFGELRAKFIKPAVDELLEKGLFRKLEIERKRGSEEFRLVWEVEKS